VNLAATGTGEEPDRAYLPVVFKRDENRPPTPEHMKAHLRSRPATATATPEAVALVQEIVRVVTERILFSATGCTVPASKAEVDERTGTCVDQEADGAGAETGVVAAEAVFGNDSSVLSGPEESSDEFGGDSSSGNFEADGSSETFPPSGAFCRVFRVALLCNALFNLSPFRFKMNFPCYFHRNLNNHLYITLFLLIFVLIARQVWSCPAT